MTTDNFLEFAKAYNDTETHPTINDLAMHLKITVKTVSNRAGEYRRAYALGAALPALIERRLDLSGVYKIENELNGKVYVGQAANLNKRRLAHFHHLRRGTHHCVPLQRSFDKYGEDAFKFSVLEVLPPNKDQLTLREQHYMNLLKSHIDAGGYNIAPAANSSIGVKYTEESRKKMSLAQKGRIVSDEARAKISSSLTGRGVSSETREKRRLAMTGQKRTEGQKRRMREASCATNNTPTYEAFGKSQYVTDWAEEYGINRKTLQNRVKRGGMTMEEALSVDVKEKKKKIPHYGVVGAEPLSETLIPKEKEGTREECIEDLRRIAIANPEISIGRNYYRVNGKFAESVWSGWAGTFEEFKRQAGLKLSRQQHSLERAIAKHASVDHYRQLTVDRKDYGSAYLKDGAGRFKTMMVCSDLHDVEIDQFYLRVWLDTVARVQPDIIVYNGDVFDLPEFGKYGVDPREWDVTNRIKYVHEKIFAPTRKAAPGAQNDFIEGNHEARLLRHLADATPALRAVLSDLHGFTIPKLLGLDAFEINYVAKADLGAFTKQDFAKQLANNYKVYYGAFICHHFPHARKMGLPGVNGHHHSHQVWPCYSPVYGAYEWHQLGSGHKRSASYCEGEKWHNGFDIVHIDTHTRSTTHDYVTVTDHAVAGGKWFYREPGEVDQSVPKSISF